MASFSSAGPTALATLKPDVTAVGTNFYTAAQTVNSSGDLYDASGWTITQGTSFSAPLVAGAVALLKSAKPGLSAAQYRSLIINSARALPINDQTASPTLAGGGLLDLSRAVSSTLTASPTSVDFGAGRNTVDGSVDVRVTNTGAGTDTFSATVETAAGALAPATTPSTFTLDPGATQTVTVTLSGKDLDPGSYSGFVTFAGTTGASETRVPYWFGSAGSTPAGIAILQTGSGSARQSVSRAIVLRVVDIAGLGLDIRPTVEADASGARVNSVYPTGDIAGTYAVDIRLGTSNATFTITVGDVKQTAIVGLN
ncbi:MAG: S8 family serine peptidase, partial [Bryobacteraceae bacterium]